MRVLVVTNMYPSAAATFRGVFVARQVEALQAIGLTVEVEEIAGSRGRADYCLARSRVRRRVRQFGPDIVHVHYGYSAPAALGHGRPIVLTLHGSDLRTGMGAGWARRLGAHGTRFVARWAARILVQNEAMRCELPAALQARTIVLPNGIDESMFRPLPKAEARARLELPAGELIALFVDAGDPRRKRPDLAAATMRRITDSGRPARLLRASGVPAHEMPWHYAAADLLLMTSDYEGSPMCVKEALACGRPVVSVPVGDVPEVVNRPERGRIVPRDPARLADAAMAIAAQPESGMSLLPDGLRSDVIARELVGVYQSVQASRSRHAD